MCDIYKATFACLFSVFLFFFLQHFSTLQVGTYVTITSPHRSETGRGEQRGYTGGDITDVKCHTVK